MCVRALILCVSCVQDYFPFTDPSLELEIYFNGDWLEGTFNGMGGLCSLPCLHTQVADDRVLIGLV